MECGTEAAKHAELLIFKPILQTMFIQVVLDVPIRTHASTGKS
jgi:hypothetical protein